MLQRQPWLPVLGVAWLFAFAASAAEPPEGLPTGARARLGTTRLRDSNGWNSAALMPDGKVLLGFDSRGITRLDVSTGRPVGEPVRPGEGVPVGRPEIASNGQRAATAGYAGVTVWDTTSGVALAKLERRAPYGDGTMALSADGKVVAVGGTTDFAAKDRPITAIVWDVEKNLKLAEVAVVQNQVSFVALSPDGKFLATWGHHFASAPPGGVPAADAETPGRTVQFWDVSTGKELCRTVLESYGTPTVVFSPDAQMAAVGSGNGLLKLIDPKTGTIRRQMLGRAGQAMRIAFSPDGKRLAMSGQDGSVQMLDVAEGRRLATVDCPLGSISVPTRIQFIGADRVLAWAALGPTALVWEVPSGKVLSPIGGHTGDVVSIAFTADGKDVLTGAKDGLILRWEAMTGKLIGPVTLRSPGLGGGLRTVYGFAQFAPDGATVLWDGPGSRALYDLASGTPIISPGAALGFNSRVYHCPDMRTVVSTPVVSSKTPPKSIRAVVWDMATGSRGIECEMPVGDMVAAAVTRDRSKLTTMLLTRPPADGKPEILITGWDMTTGAKLGELTQPVGLGFGTHHVIAGADNRTVLASATEGRFVVVDIVDGKLLREIELAGNRATGSPVLSPDGKTLAVPVGGGGLTSPGGGMVRLHDWGTGRLIRSFDSGHAGVIGCVAFSPDGKTLASGSADTTVVLWDLSTGK